MTLQYCDGFCHTSTWIGHMFTCVLLSFVLFASAHIPEISLLNLSCFPNSSLAAAAHSRIHSTLPTRKGQAPHSESFHKAGWLRHALPHPLPSRRPWQAGGHTRAWPSQTCSWPGWGFLWLRLRSQAMTLLVPEQALALSPGQRVTRLLGARGNGPFPRDARKLNYKGNPVLKCGQAKKSPAEEGPLPPRRQTVPLITQPQTLWGPCALLRVFHTRTPVFMRACAKSLQSCPTLLPYGL